MGKQGKQNKKCRHTFGKGVLVVAVVLIGAAVLVGDFGVVTRALELELGLSTSLVLQQKNKKQPMAKEWNWFVYCVCIVCVGRNAGALPL